MKPIFRKIVSALLIFLVMFIVIKNYSQVLNSGTNNKVLDLYRYLYNWKVESDSEPVGRGKENFAERNPSEILLIMKSIINFPAWYCNEDWGLRKSVSLENIKVNSRGWDGEEETAWNNFFFGTTNGLMIEMGALNGNDFSVSHFFEFEAHWRTILIEGNPKYASHLSEFRPNSLNFNLAICENPSTVHYMGGGVIGVDGILEFMTPAYMKRFYPSFLTNGLLDLKIAEKNVNVKKVHCVSLTNLLLLLNITHVNFFLLDTEGGELNILNAIDFEKITFDVIAVETDRGLDCANDTKAYVDSIIQLVTSKGYLLWARKVGRNSWFYSPKFQPYNRTKN